MAGTILAKNGLFAKITKSNTRKNSAPTVVSKYKRNWSSCQTELIYASDVFALLWLFL